MMNHVTDDMGFTIVAPMLLSEGGQVSRGWQVDAVAPYHSDADAPATEVTTSGLRYPCFTLRAWHLTTDDEAEVLTLDEALLYSRTGDVSDDPGEIERLLVSGGEVLRVLMHHGRIRGFSWYLSPYYCVGMTTDADFDFGGCAFEVRPWPPSRA